MLKPGGYFDEAALQQKIQQLLEDPTFPKIQFGDNHPQNAGTVGQGSDINYENAKIAATTGRMPTFAFGPSLQNFTRDNGQNSIYNQLIRPQANRAYLQNIQSLLGR